MELTWAAPTSGDYDDFVLQWTPPDPLSITQAHLKRRVVGGMYPGRRYNLTVATVCGGGAKGGPTVRSQTVEMSVRTSRCH